MAASLQAFEPPAVSGVGSSRRLPVHAAGPGRQHPLRPGSRGPPDRGRQPRAQGPDRPVHHLLRQRSAGAGHHRPREGQGDGHSLSQITTHARRLHGLGVRQRLRLQQPHLSRLCAGRPAVPHERQRSAQLLRALRLRPDGSARQPGHGHRERRRRRSSTTTISSAPSRSTALPRPATAPARDLQAWKSWPSRT